MCVDRNSERQRDMENRTKKGVKYNMEASIGHETTSVENKEMQRRKQRSDQTETGQQRQPSSKDKKLALQKDVDRLKMKLRCEENISRALKRALNRKLGALPRLPPYLRPSTLELLAEVAVLEEEVVRLEEQVVQFRKDLFQEAMYTSSSKWEFERFVDLYQLGLNVNPTAQESKLLRAPETRQGKENQSCTNCTKKEKGVFINKACFSRIPVKKLQIDCKVRDQEIAELGSISPNKISEEIVRCLSGIFIRMSSKKLNQDPYGTCPEFGKRDIGPYKDLVVVEAGTINSNRMLNSLSLLGKLKILLGKLALVDTRNPTHHAKLAFWINIYNSCMMNAFMEYGIPESPQMIVGLMQKATINVGGHLVNAFTIEHCILRPPHQSKEFSKRMKNSKMTMRSELGLELYEPLVNFALSCGSWSSPAVRVYTASQVENELEVAKRDYLQAAVGITYTEFVIPKLLDWYLLDFARDMESLLHWICLQLPSELRKQAITCLERHKSKPSSQFVHVTPYEFSFRYLL